jgi:putative ABC transport system ATP-binding protein
MVTHDPRAAAFADRVVFLRDGLVVHQLKPAPNTQAIMDVMAQLEL